MANTRESFIYGGRLQPGDVYCAVMEAFIPGGAWVWAPAAKASGEDMEASIPGRERVLAPAAEASGEDMEASIPGGEWVFAPAAEASGEDKGGFIPGREWVFGPAAEASGEDMGAFIPKYEWVGSVVDYENFQQPYAVIFRNKEEKKLHILFYPGKDNDGGGIDTPLKKIIPFVRKQLQELAEKGRDISQEELDNATEYFIVEENNRHFGVRVAHYVAAIREGNSITIEDSIDYSKIYGFSLLPRMLSPLVQYNTSYIQEAIKGDLNITEITVKQTGQQAITDSWQCGHYVIEALRRKIEGRNYQEDFTIAPKVIEKHQELCRKGAKIVGSIQSTLQGALIPKQGKSTPVGEDDFNMDGSVHPSLLEDDDSSIEEATSVLERSSPDVVEVPSIPEQSLAKSSSSPLPVSDKNFQDSVKSEVVAPSIPEQSSAKSSSSFSYHLLMGATIGAIILLSILVVATIGVLTSGFGLPLLAGPALAASALLTGLAATVGNVGMVAAILGAATTAGAFLGSLVGAVVGAVRNKPQVAPIEEIKSESTHRKMAAVFGSSTREVQAAVIKASTPSSAAPPSTKEANLSQSQSLEEKKEAQLEADDGPKATVS